MSDVGVEKGFGCRFTHLISQIYSYLFPQGASFHLKSNLASVYTQSSWWCWSFGSPGCQSEKSGEVCVSYHNQVPSVAWSVSPIHDVPSASNCIKNFGLLIRCYPSYSGQSGLKLQLKQPTKLFSQLGQKLNETNFINVQAGNATRNTHTHPSTHTHTHTHTMPRNYLCSRPLQLKHKPRESREG